MPREFSELSYFETASPFLSTTSLMIMHTIFDPQTTAALISRIEAISEKQQAQWGKMNVYQMIKHCTLCEDMFLGNLVIKRVWIGRLIGPMVLKKLLKDDKPFGKNSPTSPVLKIAEQTGDLEQEKREWISRIQQYSSYTAPGFVHPFFGPMTRDQVGIFSYKHADHHLRQFGA